MSEPNFPLVIGKNELRGRLETDISGSGASSSGSYGIVHLENGQLVKVPLSVLVAQNDGSYYLPLALEDLQVVGERRSSSAGAENVVIPLIAEEVTVEKRLVETGRVRLRKTVQEHEEIIDEPLLREEVSVTSIKVGRVIDGPAPAPRQEGDTLIIPVMEEVLVVEKRLMLMKEIHVRREQQAVHNPQTVTLRREEIHAERVPPKQTTQAVTNE